MRFPRIKNYHIATKDVGDRIIFLRTLKEGGSQHSFGIHVAKMAGMPDEVVQRANEILHELELKAVEVGKTSEVLRSVPAQPMQMNFFQASDEQAQKLKKEIQEKELAAQKMLLV